MTAQLLVPPLSVAEHVFGLGEIVLDGAHATGSMRTAEWMRHDDGRPAVGVLGVVLDAVVGQPSLSVRPDGSWPVTTELSIDVAAPPDPAGERVDVAGELLAADGASALTQGAARAADGSLRAVATARNRYTPGDPDFTSATTPDAATPRAAAEAQPSVRAALGAHLAVDGSDLVHLQVPPSPTLLNSVGNVHGGMIVCVADVLANAAWHRPDAPALVTAALRIAYLRPGSATGPLELTARLCHRGRTTALVDVDAVGGDGRLCATARVTAHRPGA